MARVISRDQLVEGLRVQRGAKVVTIVAKTQPALLAKHPETGALNPYRGQVVKISTVNGLIGWQYEASVNRQREREEKEPDFEALPRKWGQRVKGTPLVEYEGKDYVELKVQKSIEHHYETLDGQPIDAEAVEQFLRKQKPGRQGVDREVILRDYAAESILALRVDGVEYVVQ